MGSRLKNIFLFDTSASSNVPQVQEQIMEDNRTFALIWSTSELVYWGYCLFMSFREADFIRCRYAYIFAIVSAALAWVCAVFLMKKLPWLIYAAKVLIYLSLLGGGMLIAWILLQTDTKTITIFASVLIAPVFFVNNTLSNIIMALIDIIAAFILLSFGLDPNVYRWAMTCLIIFSSIGVTLAHFINKARFERYVFAESAVQLAESNAKLAELQTRFANYDPMTGLRNRRSFSEKEDKYTEELPPYCCIVMADINGLKAVNDSLGHEAGDELIIGTAECLRKSFEGISSVYRIGGDEFCVILTNPEINVDKHLKILDKESPKWKGEYIDGISISSGDASSEEFSGFREILIAADQRMYENKKAYYSAVDKKKA